MSVDAVKRDQMGFDRLRDDALQAMRPRLSSEGSPRSGLPSFMSAA
jgi:hypothetical protein